MAWAFVWLGTGSRESPPAPPAKEPLLTSPISLRSILLLTPTGEIYFFSIRKGRQDIRTWKFCYYHRKSITFKTSLEALSSRDNLPSLLIYILAIPEVVRYAKLHHASPLQRLPSFLILRHPKTDIWVLPSKPWADTDCCQCFQCEAVALIPTCFQWSNASHSAAAATANRLWKSKMIFLRPFFVFRIMAFLQAK